MQVSYYTTIIEFDSISITPLITTTGASINISVSVSEIEKKLYATYYYAGELCAGESAILPWAEEIIYYEPFSSASWEEISEVSTLGLASANYNIGDTKVDGGITWEIADFDHDALADGTGKAGITLIMTSTTTSTYTLNSTSTNVGGWNSCTFRTTTLPTLKQTLFSEDLRNVVKTVLKPTGAGNQSTSIVYSEDDFWLLSQMEIFGTVNSTYSSVIDGVLYPIFTDATARARNATTQHRLRTPRTNNSTAFIHITTAGAIGGSSANTARVMCFGCCI